ncbi:MAG TPA: transporter substrate-binding domain-containing protein, partial [Pseudonocardia sp.]|nr:transporter substrate-binding domain-containing protein [Pseudonocardia sp.]
ATMLAAAALVAGLAACGSGEPESTTPAAAGGGTGGVEIEGVGTIGADPALAELVPAEYREKGEVVFATNAPYSPFIDFREEGRTDAFTGLDYDLVQAASAKLDLDAPFQQQPFDGLIPGLQAGNFDAIVGGITDNKERQEVATFVDYSASGTGFLALAGNPLGIGSVEDLCGVRVAVQRASNQQENLEEYSTESCGDNPIEVLPYPENPQAVSAMLAGNADVVAATLVSVADIAEELSGQVELVENAAEPNGWRASPNGFGFLRADAELAAAYQAAMQSLVDDGTYAAVLEKYGQTRIGIETITIDQAVD